MGRKDAEAETATETDSLPEAAPDILAFRPCIPHAQWLDIAFNDIADEVRSGRMPRPDWQRWTVIPEDDALAMVYPPGLYFEGWLTAPHAMNPVHREPAGLSVPPSVLS